MRSSVFVLLCVLFLSGVVFSKKLADLPEVMQPRDIHVYGDRIFIGDNNSIHVYSMKDFKQLKQFGREGDGPGEFKFNIRLEVFPKKLVVNTFGKLIFFSHEGSLIKEYKLKPEISNIYPVGSNFIGSVYEGPKTQKINLYDQEIKFLKILYEGSLGPVSYWHSDAKKIDLMMVKDYVDKRVYKDRIYIFDTRKGFYFGVYDNVGKKLYEVTKEYKSLKISEEYKAEMIRKGREKPGLEKWKNKINYLFPDFFPAYRTIRFADDKMYFVTYSGKNGKDETIVTDLKGNFLGKAVVPSELWLFSISKDKLYYLVENEDAEMWELFGEEIKGGKHDN